MVDKKILVVDDSEIICSAFQKELSQAGYFIDVALNGGDAIDKAKKAKYDLVFVDIIMPGINGVEACKAIKEINPDSIVVYMTGKVDEESDKREKQFHQAGGEPYYLYKPFFAGEILNITKNILR